jgi:hypothetical protein
LPRAVFGQLAPAESSLLSHLLYPDSGYADLLYRDVSAVADGERPSATYCDEYFNAVCSPSGLELESAGPEGKRARLKLTLDDAKYLLLKWKLECQRWETSRAGH